MKRLTLGFVSLLAGVATAANTWWVDDDAAAGGNGSEASPFQNIQAAISAAGANDTIMVKPGTYDSGSTKDAMSDGKNLSRVLITKPLRIESTDGAAYLKSFEDPKGIAVLIR